MESLKARFLVGRRGDLLGMTFKLAAAARRGGPHCVARESHTHFARPRLVSEEICPSRLGSDSNWPTRPLYGTQHSAMGGHPAPAGVMLQSSHRPIAPARPGAFPCVFGGALHYLTTISAAFTVEALGELDRLMSLSCAQMTLELPVRRAWNKPSPSCGQKKPPLETTAGVRWYILEDVLRRAHALAADQQRKPKSARAEQQQRGRLGGDSGGSRGELR